MSFEDSVREYVKLENQLKEANQALKVLKDSKTTLGKGIIKHMIQNNIDSCRLPGGGSLALKTTVQLGSINKEYIQETLKEFYKQPQPSDAEALAERTADALMTNRETKDNHTLKLLKRA